MIEARGLVVLCLVTACRSSPTIGGESTTCTIRYERLAGADSERVDELQLLDRVVRRDVLSDGENADGAIYYRYGDDGALLREEFDSGGDGQIDGALVRTERLGPVSVFVVDADLTDNTRQSSQLSVTLPTTSFGPYQPARVFYGLACEDAGDIELSANGNTTTATTPAQTLVLTFAGDQLADFVVGSERAALTYNTDGLIEGVAWYRDAALTMRATYTYVGGFLSRYAADDDGDEIDDHMIEYDCKAW